ncbi:uncharacterized protein BDV17DRAFT_86613 [Aspergillus undulatus]|uniref:uncharacterized protein n=1 Tax=Aspergillus undulatus TaxID=1810928 RepID=UPI003CCC8F7B
MNRVRRIPFPTPARTLQFQLYKVTVQGPHVENENAPDHRETLLSQLGTIPKDTPRLRIEEDTPSDTEWGILGDHFTSVRDLELYTGWNEELHDRKMPLHWPIERLNIGDACGEVVKSPHILQGRIKHLILDQTSGLRFEGPTSAELWDTHSKAVERGEEQPHYIGQDGRKVEFVFLPQLASEWLSNKYNAAGAGNTQPEPENRLADGQESHVRTLEIIENDALDTFVRMGAALPHIADGLTSLTLRSMMITDDFQWAPESVFLQLLSSLGGLQTLNLSVGDVFQEPSSISGLYKNFPPNITSLNFRSLLSLCRSERWNEWVDAFSSETFLPRLERLSFVLDLHYKQGLDGGMALDNPSDQDITEARAACEKLYEGARRRGIKVEPLHDEWAGGQMGLRAVDDRWGK